MSRKIDFSIGEYYHIYSRGVDKRLIFMEDHDYFRFNALLYVCNSTNLVDIADHFLKKKSFVELFEIDRGNTLVDIGAYCSMPNHFHILVREKIPSGITKFMRKLLTAYALYFNIKNNRTGTLFESRFKAKYVDTDKYLKYLFAYIHLNPVKIIDPHWKENGIIDRDGAKKYLKEYIFSSYLDYKGVSRFQSKILNTKVFPDYFIKTADFDTFINDWLLFNKEN